MRFALISFLNARPLWWGLIHGAGRDGNSFEFTSPARCTDLVAEGMAHLGLVPVIELFRNPELAALPSICIASRTEVRSVLLVSKVPFDAIRSVALDPSSRTSVTLARILLAETRGLEEYKRIRFDPIDRSGRGILEGHDAAVVIGDPALQLSRSSSEAPYRYDLVSKWYEKFGEPFVFALWAGRRKAMEGVDPAQILTRLERSRAFGLSQLEVIAREASEELHLPYDELIGYFHEALHYDLGAQELRAIERFSLLARQYGLVEGPRGMEWLIDPASPRS